MCLAVPGKVLEVRDDRGTRMATVDFGGVAKDICLAYLPEVGVGDYAIVHVGFAISRSTRHRRWRRCSCSRIWHRHRRRVESE